MATQTDRQELQKAMSLHQAGRLNDAAIIYRQLIDADRNNFHALHFLGVIEASAGHFDEAKRLMARSLSIKPPNIQFVENYATILFQTGDYQAAFETCQQGLQSDRVNVALLYASAISLFKLNRLDESLRQFDQLLVRQPNHVEAVNERGSLLAEMKRYDEALASFDKALAIQPRYAPAYLNKGNLYGALKRHEEAFNAYDKAIEIEPRFAEAWLGRGNILRDLKRYDEAFAAYEKALALKPKYAEAWFARGNILREVRHYDDALAAYDKAISLNANLSDAFVGRGLVLGEMNRQEDALAALLKAIDLQPNLTGAWFGRGNALRKLGRYDEAIAAFDRALGIDPKLDYVEGTRLYVKAQMCDWRNYDADSARLVASVRGGVATAPFQMLSVPSSSEDRLVCARRFAADNYANSSKSLWNGERYKHDRIRVAYLSSDLRDHPVGQLTAGLFEQHDKTRFEIAALSVSEPQASPARDRIRAAAEHFIDGHNLSDQKIAELLREREVDIAIDLNGYTEGARQNVFAQKPAPIQANYLGYACTMGTNCFDYIVADRVAVPSDQFQFYSEKVVWLADSFMVNDSKREISDRTPTRTECGLPEKGVVFCCFNNTYKIAPDVFRVWMRLLGAVEGSVLWLSNANPIAATNLRREAEASGVAPERLIFAPRVPDNADHLARQGQADLFLDTLPYNAHATTADALWAGLPVLTCAGDTFAGRVAASLLNAVGLAELITNSLEEYEALALKIARDPNLLASLKKKLKRNRLTYPLFDTTRFARNIEAAYVKMWERYQAGLPPEHFAVEPTPD